MENIAVILEKCLHKIISRIYRFFLKDRRYDTPDFASREDTECPKGCLNRYDMLNLAFKFNYGNYISGDYFEFGCWTARTFRMAYDLSRKPYSIGGNSRFHKPIHLYAFDSFKGLPKLSKIDEDKKWKEGYFITKREEFIKILEKHKIKRSDYTIIEGFYNETLNKDLQCKMQGVKAGVVYIDCDIYESTKQVLEFLVPFLQNGTVVCFDDYWCYQGNPERGESRALSEFENLHPDIMFRQWHDFSWAGKSFIVHLKNINEMKAESG